MHGYSVLGVGATLVHSFIADYDNHWQSDLNHYLMFFVQKSGTILDSVLIMIKTEVICWHGHPELVNSFCDLSLP